jgi:hypothetical protein
MGTGFAENREQRSDAGTFQKEMETYAKSITDELLQTSIAKTTSLNWFVRNAKANNSLSVIRL